MADKVGSFVQKRDLSHVAAIVPTCDAARHWPGFVAGLRAQGLAPSQVLVVDSSSEDGTRDLAQAEGFRVFRIERSEFNHGGTRQAALAEVPWATVAVYLTQDAVLATPDSIQRLIGAFEDPRMGAAYGRQLPRPGAGAIESHARLFNYPAKSDVRDLESRHVLGFRAAFLSNSFSAYRISALSEVGGFPTNTMIAEDTVATAKLLLRGWKAAYVAEAQVYHSHDFTMREEFRRYYEFGVCHRQTAWLREQFGTAGGEGQRFVVSELKDLFPRHMHLIPLALMRTCSKAVGYHAGLRQRVALDPMEMGKGAAVAPDQGLGVPRKPLTHFSHSDGSNEKVLRSCTDPAQLR